MNGAALEVLWAFLKLGCTSFGGPIAHIGYFREEFVVRRRWLDEPSYANFVALCQFLPGPTSSQVGFAVGLRRAGYLGAMAAWVGFTLPSAVAMILFAYGARSLIRDFELGLVHGLKLVAVVIVAHALWGMVRTLCPDRTRAGIAGVTMVFMIFGGAQLWQLTAILLGGLAGLWWCRSGAPIQQGTMDSVSVSRSSGAVALAMFCLLLVGLPILSQWRPSQYTALFNAFYHAGALVFGGGHVVLPLLREVFVPPGWISDDGFLAGYGVAQAIPGPLFSVAAFLGAVAGPSPLGIAGAALGLLAIFLPGFLVLLGVLPFWELLRTRADAQGVSRGVNAAVVGILGAALYNPLWITAVRSVEDIALVIIGFVLLASGRVSPLAVVVFGAIAGIAMVGLGT